MVTCYFDLDGTLVRHTASFEEMFVAAREGLGIPDRDRLHDSYVTAFLDYFSACNDEPYRAAMSDICAEFDLPTDSETFADARIEAELERTELVSGVHELLTDLETDHTLGVLTNGVGRVQREKLRRHGLFEYFDAEIISCEVGVSKPDAEIFELARRELPGEEYAFVADDLERDVLPAQAVGFTGVWISETDGSRADASIDALSEVRPALA
ncbi:HAD family hydrolase (plasmid) [Haladaptatus sp. SPP-AMP-3]|uniref:HAD family hydrolase n=1 Tax=Haladaptatus sp. SPP-AMP-3 TaxID=3121295 RepID=UPI003C2EFCAB